MNLKKNKEEITENKEFSEKKELSDFFIKLFFTILIWIVSPYIVHILMIKYFNFSLGFPLCICSILIFFKMIDFLRIGVTILGIVFWIPKALFRWISSLSLKTEYENPKEPWFVTFFEEHHHKLFIIINTLFFYIIGLFITNTSNEMWLCLGIGAIYGCTIWLLKVIWGHLEVE